MKQASKYRAVKSGYAAELIRRLGIGFCLILACSTASAIPLSGDQTTGVISVAGEVDDFTFDAVAGETIVLRVADTSGSDFFPRIELYDPSGAFVTSGEGQFVGTATAVATVSGGYTALVRDDSASGPNDTGVGSYVLNFVQTLGTVELSQLANDSENLETIDQGDLDTYTLSANVGDTLVLRVTDTSDSAFFPRVELYDPNGVFVSFGEGQAVGTATHVAAMAGTYRVLVRDDSASGGGDSSFGDYNLRFARLTDANELGELANDSENLETIDQGDLDTYILSANVGDTLVLRVTDTSESAFFPRVELYDPNGVFVTFGEGQAVGTATHVAAMAGTYRVLVRDDSASGGGDSSFGDYNLRFARLTDANELGELANDSENLETIDQGDLDTYTLSANVGDTLVLRVTDTSESAFFPRVELYDPNGVFVTFGEGQAVGTATHVAAMAGTYRVLVRDDSASGGSDSSFGDYNLRFARVTDANELGELANDSENLETIDQGDLDTYTLSANAGDTLVLRVTDTSGSAFFPRVELYDPNGVFVTFGEGQAVGTATHVAAVSGTYRVLVRDDSASGGDDSSFGDYNLRFARLPGANELGLILSGTSVTETIDLGDLDTYRLSAASGAEISLQIEDLTNTSFFPRVELYAPDGSLIAAASGQIIGSTTVETTQAGIFSLLVRDDSASGGSDSGAGVYLLSLNVTGGNGDGPTYTVGITPPTELNLDNMPINQGQFILERVVGYSAINLGADLLMAPITIDATIGSGRFNELLQIPIEFEVLNLIGRFEATDPGKPPARFDHIIGPVGTTGPLVTTIALPLLTTDSFFQITDLDSGVDTFIDGSAEKPEVSQISLFENLEIFDGRDTWFIGYRGEVIRGEAAPGQPHGGIGSPSNSGSTPVNNNNSPTVNDDEVSINEGQTVEFVFTGSDPEGQTLTWAFIDILGDDVAQQPTFDPNTQEVIWDSSGSPAPATYSIRVFAIDQNNLGDIGVLTVNVLANVLTPNVIGLTQSDAGTNIFDAGLTVGNISSENSNTVPVGSVISQTPAAGSSVAPGTAVDLVISLGVANVIVPSITGLTQSAAEADILSAGLTVGNIGSANSNTVPAGSVISQTPAAGSSVAPGTAVDLVISLGVAEVIVPSITGLTQSAAETDILSAGLTVGNIGSANSNSVPAGSVISQTPAAGSSVTPGTAVDLVISLGVADVIVPSITGLTQADAEADILSAGLTVGNIGSANSNSVPAGSVISQTPAAGSSVTPGTAVDLVISLGVAEVIVPSITGLTQADAEADILSAGLTVGNIGSANSNTVPAGSVISQTPAAGSSVAPGTTVDFVVSEGPATVSLICDVDGNSSIDIFDIRAISRARGQTALPGDVRDANGDGLISILDARTCVLQCTNARCTP